MLTSSQVCSSFTQNLALWKLVLSVKSKQENSKSINHEEEMYINGMFYTKSQSKICKNETVRLTIQLTMHFYI